jgi:hypothetical protein
MRVVEACLPVRPDAKRERTEADLAARIPTVWRQRQRLMLMLMLMLMPTVLRRLKIGCRAARIRLWTRRSEIRRRARRATYQHDPLLFFQRNVSERFAARLDLGEEEVHDARTAGVSGFDLYVSYHNPTSELTLRLNQRLILHMKFVGQ